MWTAAGIVPSWVQPPSAEGLLRRPSIERILEERRSVTTLVAPAGYGKTSALAAWVPHASGSVVWLSLRASLASSEAFLRYLRAALVPLIGPQAPWPSHAVSPETYVLDTVVLPRFEAPHAPCCIVIDGAEHLVPALWRALETAIDAHAPGLCWVFASRTPPPLPEARWRANHQAAKVVAAQLAFSAEEATVFLQARGHLGEPPSTPQWPAELALRVIDPQATGDFVATEVLAPLPAELRQFVTAISVLDPVEPEICAALHANAGAHLRELARRGLIHQERILPVVAWFAATPEAHGTAAQAYLSRGRFDEALEHRIAGVEPPGWADALSHHGWTLVRTQRNALLRRLLTTTGEDRPLFRVWTAWSRLDQAASELDEAIASARDGDLPAELVRSLDALEALTLSRRGAPRAALEAGARALSGLDQAQRGLGAALHLAQAGAHELLAEWSVAERAIEASLRLAGASPPLPTAALAFTARARVLRRQGRLTEAIALTRGAQVDGAERGWLALAAGELVQAEEQLQEAVRSGSSASQLSAWLGLAHVRWARGDPHGSQDAAVDALRVALGVPWLEAMANVHLDPYAPMPRVPPAVHPWVATERAIVRAERGLAHEPIQGLDAELDTALQEARSQGRVWDAAQLGARLAALRAPHAPEVAATVLEECFVEGLVQPLQAHEASLRPLLTRLPTALATSLRTAFGDRPGSGIDALTGREVDVLRLVEKGLTNRLISSKLRISVGTVKTHLHHALEKLGAANRTEAVHRARREGLLG